MEQAIRNFPKQFAYDPRIENADKWRRYKAYIIAGMGGSHLQGDIFQTVAPGFNLSVHQDYGLPPWQEEVLKETLVIASSYSGNTEETLSALEEALRRNFPVAAISTGGKLLELAKKHRIPYIQIPDTGIQPRAALGFTFKAFAKMVGREDIVEEATTLATQLKSEEFEDRGKLLAETLKEKIPIMYSSQRNYSIAYNWKIKFNETSKIPAFYNVFPELNHNEMTGFDLKERTKELSQKIHFIFLKDSTDHPQIQKRMEVTATLYRDRGLPVEIIQLEDHSILYKIFSSLILADWTTLYTAKQYGVEPEEVPMVEEFKHRIAKN